MDKLTFMLTEKQRRFLEKESDGRNRSIGYVVRELIDGVIAKKSEKEGDHDEG